MSVRCVWEHNGADTLLWAVNFVGAYTRGASLDEALRKMPREINSYITWAGGPIPDIVEIEIEEESACDLCVRDADSDVLFTREKVPLTRVEYEDLKSLALKSARDFQNLYDSIPDPERPLSPARETFYGPVPRTAEEMYRHTKSVNPYYFGEIGVRADNEGTLFACRKRGFEALEAQPDFLHNSVTEGSYGEYWSLRKLLRRFIWHDRIHGRALYRTATRAFGETTVANPFRF